MMYELPTSVTVEGQDYAIRSDFRAILDICCALNDVQLSDSEKSYLILFIFYPDFESIPQAHYQQAVERCFWFIDGGNDKTNDKSAKLMDWQQDFRYIISPVNRVLGCEIRSKEYIHWWTFLSAYFEIGDCLFAQIVNIRAKKQKGQALDKSEREFYRKNRAMIDLKTPQTETETGLLAQWGAK